MKRRHDACVALPTATLEEVLIARERRVARQSVLLERFGFPVLSLTLVSPGPVKDSRGRRLLMDLAETVLADACWHARMTIEQHSRIDGATGPEALWVVAAAPEALKRLAIEIENSKSWGRLLDADVVVADARGVPIPLERQVLGYPPRRCLLCGADAKDCMGSHRHSPAAVAARATELIQRFTGRP